MSNTYRFLSENLYTSEFYSVIYIDYFIFKSNVAKNPYHILKHNLYWGLRFQNEFFLGLFKKYYFDFSYSYVPKKCNFSFERMFLCMKPIACYILFSYVGTVLVYRVNCCTRQVSAKCRSPSFN